MNSAREVIIVEPPALVVLAGLPGVGKTSISRLLGARLSAAVLRVDVIEAAIMRNGLAAHPLGPVGYTVAYEVAKTSLAAGTSVVIDAVNPVAEARAGWRALADPVDAAVFMVEVVLADEAEHRRRVQARASDVDGLVVPTWDEVIGSGYEPWDQQRDGTRLIVDGGDTAAAVDAIIAYKTIS